MEDKKYIIVEPIVNNNLDEDRIDLVILLKIIKDYKKFIISFTLFFTILISIYVYYFIKPIYEIRFLINPPYILQNNKKNYFIKSTELAASIKYKFNKSDTPPYYPKVNSKIKQGTDLINIIIEDYSNTKALNTQQNIMKFIKKRENFFIEKYKLTIKENINLLEKSIKLYKNEIVKLEKQTQITNDANILNILLTNIASYKSIIMGNKTKILNYKMKLKNNLIGVQLIGNIKIKDKPIKPKKKFIIATTFILSLIFAIFFVSIYNRFFKSSKLKY